MDRKNTTVAIVVIIESVEITVNVLPGSLLASRLPSHQIAEGVWGHGFPNHLNFPQ
jgi:hypothetical protein